MNPIRFAATLLKSQLFTNIPYPTADFTDQTIIVTGSNTGLGLEAARHFVRLGAAKVILAVRTVTKGEAAAADIIQSTRTKENTIEVWNLDLSSYDSVIAFGARLQTLERLDALVQNAGVLTSKFTLSEGLESHIGINVVSATLAGLLALPKLRESAHKFGVRTRLGFVGSDLHYIAQFKESETLGPLLDALNKEDGADLGDRYPLSKLLLLFTVREIAARSPISAKSNVIINYLTPGACKSDLFRDEMGWLRGAAHSVLLSIFARTTEVGGRTYVHAVKPDIEKETHGAFLMDCKIAPNGPNVDSPRGQQLQKRWIDELFPRLESIAPGCTKVLE